VRGGGSVADVNRVRDRLRAIPPQIADGLIGLALLGVGIAGLYGPVWIEQPYREPDILGYALLVLQTLPLAWRRIRPGAVLAVIGLSISAYLVLEYLPTNATLAVLIAIYSFAAHSERYRKLAITGITAVTAFVYLGGRFYAERAELTWELIIVNVAIFAAAWLIGDNVRVRREQATALESRARRLERERDERARRAVVEERARIARELHDVVAHNVSVMVVQAGAARRQAGSGDDRVGETVASIERVGRQALNDLRRLLGVLRTEEETGAAALTPQPGVGQIEVLVDELRSAGVAVSLRTEGEPRRLPQGVDLTAYRIAQEALTNVLKHAGPASAEVTVRYADDAVEVEIVDDGRGAASGLRTPTGGQGLVGMRERVALYDGDLHVGPRPGGGYRVHARLPLAAAPPAEAADRVAEAGGR
jgi:signal transduction histidine kinase